jgi:hypothetical protein
MPELKFVTGERVIYRHNVGGFGKIKEYEAVVLLAGHKLKEQSNNNKGWKYMEPYIIRTEKFDCFALERDLKKLA